MRRRWTQAVRRSPGVSVEAAEPVELWARTERREIGNGKLVGARADHPNCRTNYPTRVLTQLLLLLVEPFPHAFELLHVRVVVLPEQPLEANEVNTMLEMLRTPRKRPSGRDRLDTRPSRRSDGAVPCRGGSPQDASAGQRRARLVPELA